MNSVRVVMLAFLVLLSSCYSEKNFAANRDLKTICNPLDLSYRFRPFGVSRREAADPTVITFKGTYYLFASKSGGYWYSDDLVDWVFVQTDKIPTEEYAPTAMVFRDAVYLATSANKNRFFRSEDPKSGQWENVFDRFEHNMWDPTFFLDDDNRLYFYWGCSSNRPIYGVEVNPDSFKPLSKPIALFNSNVKEYGWEVPGDYNDNDENRPWIEGAWVNKFNGKYYLQYAGPGTEFKSYNDGIYISDSPLGHYKIAAHNPFAYKPEGFACGAGHGSTFEDKYGNLWHVGTVSISVKHMFERRLALYPAHLDSDGALYTSTKYGDYPISMPDKKISSPDAIFPGWMLLSYQKSVDVSSSIDLYEPAMMNDEDIRTYWASKTGGDEWAIMDLGAQYDVYAVQINFAEHNTNLFGRQKAVSHKYLIETSDDKKSWKVLIDKSKNLDDNSHDYTQLSSKTKCRYLRIKNIEVPDGNFAISGFRVFGIGNGPKPSPVERLKIKRNPDDRRVVKLAWEKSDNVTGYNVSYGIEPNKLYHNYIVYDDTTLTINSLNVNQDYYFTIESFNENGITASNLKLNEAF